MAEQIRILHVLGNTQLGGAESRIMDLYRQMDRSKIQFDFLVHTQEAGYFDKEIQRLGGRIYRVPRFRLYNYFSYRRAVRHFFAVHHEFQMVQGHITSTAGIYLPIAKRMGIPMTAAHARSAGVDQGIKGILTRFMRRNLDKKADYLFTCSEIAGISVFGRKAVEQGKTIFIANAIDTEAFGYDERVHQRLREELGISDRTCVIGHVGRFHYAKNHAYLLQVFARLCQKETEQKEEAPSYILLLLGEGAGMESIKKLADEWKIRDRVLFLGNRSNVNEYYQAMDYFVYPSRFEGLPGTIVEAQCAGLQCLMSDSICQEAAVTELVKTMSITEEPGKWAEEIIKNAEYERKSRAVEMAEAGFDVKVQAEAMMQFYETGDVSILKEMRERGKGYGRKQEEINVDFPHAASGRL